MVRPAEPLPEGVKLPEPPVPELVITKATIPDDMHSPAVKEPEEMTDRELQEEMVRLLRRIAQ